MKTGIERIPSLKRVLSSREFQRQIWYINCWQEYCNKYCIDKSFVQHPFGISLGISCNTRDRILNTHAYKSLPLNFPLLDRGDAIAESCFGGPFGNGGIIVETRRWCRSPRHRGKRKYLSYPPLAPPFKRYLSNWLQVPLLTFTLDRVKINFLD